MYTHLHVQSAYSFLRGLAPPGDLVRAALRHNLPALALTDHQSLTGAIEFYEICRAAGVKPILGVEANARPAGQLKNVRPGVVVLLAMDMAGWRSLCRLISGLAGENDHLTPDALAKDNTGLLCLTGGQRSWLSYLVERDEIQAAQDWLGQLQAIFDDRLYVELQYHTPADEALINRMARLAHQQNLPIVATHDVHYLEAEQAHLQRILTAIRLIQPYQQLAVADCAPPNASLVDFGMMEQHFSHYPSALENIGTIIARCQLELPTGKPHFPEVTLPEGLSLIDHLRRKAEEGACQVYGELTPAIRQRLDYELGVIDQCGYAALFLIVADILEFARQNRIPFSSRGSAASSLVAHCLGISSPDPLRLNLYFERFLNPARANPPDIDTDLCSRRRDEVIQYVYERFGQERTATVCTINTFRSRSALRETAKAYGLPAETITQLTEALPHRWFGPSDRRNDKEDPYGGLRQRYNTPLYQNLLRDASALIGLPHHLSVHPGGVVIAPGSLTDLAPTQMASKGIRITQFDLDSIARLGLVKIDLLGIRGLTVLGDVAEKMARDTQEPIAQGAASLHLDPFYQIPEVDEATSETLRNAKTIGCFQIESPGMRATLKEIQASTIDDLMVALALYRPGPLTGGMKNDFVRRHLAIKKMNGAGTLQAYELHPALTPLLAETHGVILYQEQVLRIAHELAGLSLAEADLLRRAMSHFDPGKQMQTLKEKFIAGADERHQVPVDIAERVWELMAAFAGYGFPKAHAASYAKIGWRSAWCKTHHPAIFMAAVLANWGGYYSQRVYLTEARRMGLPIRPPHVNYAGQQFCVHYIDRQPVLFMGMDQVRELTRRTQQAILQERPFSSLMDFLVRVDPRRQEAENLAKVGALQGFGTIPELVQRIQAGGWRGKQFSLFANPLAAEPEWSMQQRVAAQQEILGMWVDAHPLELAGDRIRAAQAMTTLEAAARLGERIRLAGMRLSWQRGGSNRGETIYFMSLEDLEGMLDIVILADVYDRHRSAFKKSGPYVVEGMVEYDTERGEPFVLAEHVWLLE